MPALLIESYPAFPPAAITSAEQTFRAAMGLYGAGLALPSPQDENAAAVALALRARATYGVELSMAQSKGLLVAAGTLVAPDYWPAILDAIERVRDGLINWLATH